MARKALCIAITLLTIFLFGTVVVLSTVVTYFGVDYRDVITETEMRLHERWAAQAASSTPGGGDQKVLPPVVQPVGEGEALVAWVELEGAEEGLLEGDDAQDPYRGEVRRRAEDNSTAVLPGSDALIEGLAVPKMRIPKIIHQTWKEETLPERWEKVRQSCIDIHPDYEFKLWSDASSRAFIADKYPWFLQNFDGYPYPIQRADAIRYFVLHHYGGVYLDLDVGCRRSLDPLLYFEVILPATIPVGVSNDVMLSEKEHPFMDLVIHNLVTFDHQYGTNYPTVMFSTGPMFLSAQYGLWPKDDGEGAERQVRVLPRRWYGKNAPLTEMGESFFEHFYGSSWHADDAGFITFLGKFGIVLMYVGFAVVALGLVRLVWSKRFKSSPRTPGPIALPYHDGLPFTRPGTPNSASRPGSPFCASRSSTPAGSRLRREDVAPAGKGVLYYLPVWFLPPTDGNARPAGPSTPTQATGWSQYLPSLPFDDQSDHRYQAIPDFSRPGSPSSNSILYAPGAHHDGAFDGTPLHSLQSSSCRPTSPTQTAPSSPLPPAYSTFKNWGSALFRSAASTSPRAATSLLPFVAPPPLSSPPRPKGKPSPPPASSTTGSSSRPSAPHAPPRARSPLPPLYSPVPVTAGHSRGPSLVRTVSGNGGGTSSAAETTAVESDGDVDEFVETDGRGVEEEVDRLLSEMTPDIEGKARGEE